MHRVLSAAAAQADALGMIYGGNIKETRTWVETCSLLVTKVDGAPFGTYYAVTLTDMADEDDRAELDRLERELGKNLANCVVELREFKMEHPRFPGSQRFWYVTIYGG